MSFFKNCCEWACARIVVACYANDLISVASTEHLLSRPVREVIEAGIHEKMYRQKQLFNRHGYNLAIFKGGHVKGKHILALDVNLEYGVSKTGSRKRGLENVDFESRSRKRGFRIESSKTGAWHPL